MERTVDVLIAGAGQVGLAVAVAIASARPSLEILVIDAAPEDAWQRDSRASAIASAPMRMLDRLGCGAGIREHAEPIREMIITDSRTGDPVRPVLLTFGGEVGPGEPFAHMVPNRVICETLRRRLGELGVAIGNGAAAEEFEAGPAWMRVRLTDGRFLRARLLVAADGIRSQLRELAGIGTVRFDYGQSGIVCTVAHERPHGGRAVEHFLPAGPFATLPLKGNRSCVVWTESHEEARRLVQADPLVFAMELERRFGLEFGAIAVEDTPRSWPLALQIARSFVAPRLALAGDAAHGIHPIAGQGANLGFRDVAALAETVVEADRLGRDIGAIDALRRYERWRRFDTVRMGVTTDVLNRLFSNDVPPLRAVRDFGLGLVDRMPMLKDYFIRQAAGISGSAPRLLKGEPI